MVQKPYILIYRPGHPMADTQGKILLHRFRMSEFLGRPLRRDEIVHHANHDPSDNSIQNLILMTRRAHGQHHSKPKTLVPQKCAKCGKTFLREKRQIHPGEPFCSRRCRGLFFAGTTPTTSKTPDAFQHGAYLCYRNGCRCVDCTEANNARMREYRASRRR